MSRENEGNASETEAGNGAVPPGRFEKGGYRPTNMGYAADSTREYSATNSSLQRLPKAPEGGTGVTPPAAK